MLKSRRRGAPNNVTSPPEIKGITKEEARSGLTRLQNLIGILLLLSALTGAYLLATDRSLWLLALSHAYGLMAIIGVDIVVGLYSLSSSKRAYIPSLAAAVLALVLQLGDILTAPQYNQTIQHFAGYLFGLAAFDLLLVLQGAIIGLGVLGRPYATYLARRKSRRGRELSYSRRAFVKSMVGFGGLIGIAAFLSSIKIQLPSQLSTTTTISDTAAPPGAIAKLSDLVVGAPVYFYYPSSSYPNVLMKNPDDSLTAISILCTHVCCECEQYPAYQPPAKPPTPEYFTCPCHGSVFDTKGNVLQGPANVPLPSVSLSVVNGYVVPTGVSNPGPCQA